MGALDVLSAALVRELAALLRAGHQGAQGPQMGVGGEGGKELLAQAGEKIDDSGREGRARRQDFAVEEDRRVGPRLRRPGRLRRSVAAGDDGDEQRDEGEQRGIGRRDHPDDPHRFGHGEIEMGRGDGIHAAQHLLVLVGPARVVDQPVGGGGDLLGRCGRAAAAESRSRPAISAARDSSISPSRYRIWPRW